MEELIDVLDEKGIHTGKVVTRKEVHTQGLWHKVVVVAIMDKNGHLLMQQRSKEVEENKEKWDVTAAGHISAGQTSKEAAIREVLEEVGIRVEEDELKYRFTYKKESSSKKDFIDNQFFDFYLVQKDKIPLEKISIQESEVQQVKVCNRQEVTQMLKDQVVVKRDAVYQELLKYLK
jgi:isopentenyldiphosphate isomerase